VWIAIVGSLLMGLAPSACNRTTRPPTGAANTDAPVAVNAKVDAPVAMVETPESVDAPVAMVETPVSGDAPVVVQPTAPAAASHLAVTFDDHLARRITWQPAASSVLVFDPTVQPGLHADGAALVFTQDVARGSSVRVNDPQLGPAQQIVVVGLATRPGGVQLEREVHTLLPDRHPDVLVSRTIYRNTGGARVHVDRVDSERLLLDGRRASRASRHTRSPRTRGRPTPGARTTR
jgi:hypothetical protein